MALFADCLDHLEWKSDIRLDGAAMSIYNIIAVAMVGIMTGVFNWLLAKAGYLAPITANGAAPRMQTHDVVSSPIIGFSRKYRPTATIMARSEKKNCLKVNMGN